MEPSTIGKLTLIYPKEINTIKSYDSDKFIIKFSSDACPPCQRLQKFLDEGNLKPAEDISIFQVKIRFPEQESVFNELRNFFSFRSVPFVVVTNKNFDLIDSMTGFDPEKFISFVGKHFKI